MSLTIADKMIVSMHFKLSDDDGNVLDSSENKDPLAYLHGVGHIIPGLEKELTGKVTGDILQVRVEPDEGYGVSISELVQSVDRSAFSGIDSLEVGMTFKAEGTDGSERPVVVKAIEGDVVTIDSNHPLADKVLHFDIQIIEVRQATAEELSHGHAH